MALMEHTCALLDDGRLRCWGDNKAGQLGFGNTDNIGDDELPTSVADVDLGAPVVRVAAGWDSTCALLEGGAVRCWGWGDSGGTGHGNEEDIGDNEPPTAIDPVDIGGQVAEIVGASGYSRGFCARLVEGAVRCWGDAGAGQLGHGNEEDVGDNESPASAGDVPIGAAVLSIAAGGDHRCAIRSDRSISCWGYNGSGQLGYGHTLSIGDDETAESAGTISLGGSVKQIVAGSVFTCALLEDGRVRCWGWAGEGQLGHGNIDNVGDDETPSSAGDVQVGGTVMKIAAGAEHTCALLDSGAVRCWGLGASGRLGYANEENIGDDETPESAGDVDVGGVVIDVEAGYDHTCALLDSGSIRCWGSAAAGSLGYGNEDEIGDDEPPSAAGDVPFL